MNFSPRLAGLRVAIRLGLFLIASIVLAGVAHADDRGCAGMKTLPFAGRSDGPEAWALLHLDGTYCVRTTEREIFLGDLIPVAVQRSGETRFIFGRRRITGELAIVAATGDASPQLVSISSDALSNLYPKATFTIGSASYLLAYDVAENLPSSRRRERPHEVLSLHRIEAAGSRYRLETDSSAFLEGGLDAGVLTASRGTVLWVCIAATCNSYAFNEAYLPRPVAKISLTVPAGIASVLELVADESGVAHVLAGLTFDDRNEPMPGHAAPAFFHCVLSAKADCNGLPSSEIPYGLRIEGGQPVWASAKDIGEAADLLVHDLKRTGLNGVANFGENNLEGRLAWSQSYYLNGLLSAIDLADELRVSRDVRADLVERFSAETGELAALVSRPYPGLMSRRYSLSREPVLSLLHNARILKPVWRGAAHVNAATLAKFANIGSIRFPEAIDALEFYGLVDGRYVARFRKGVPFWADGSDLPWNARSAWIEGVAWCPVSSDANKRTAGALGQEFADKILAGNPPKWPYATGNLLSGWMQQDGVSRNTPVFAGDKSNLNGAHISYRSMDALAVLAGIRTGLFDDGGGAAAHLATLVEDGLLFPFVNEEFNLRGEAREIPLSVARFHARAVLPWQVGNLPWALSALPSRVSK